MFKNRIAAWVAVATLVGFLGAVAAQENAELNPSKDASNQNTTEQKPWMEEMSEVVAPTPTPEPTPPTENLLTQMKVYPSF